MIIGNIEYPTLINEIMQTAIINTLQMLWNLFILNNLQPITCGIVNKPYKVLL
jgi:hypothetical protein